MPREDGLDLPSVFRGGGKQREGGDAIPQPEHGAGGLEGGQPMAAGVQGAEVGDLFLQSGALGGVALRSGTVQGNEKGRREIGHARHEAVTPLQKARRGEMFVPL